MPWMCGVFTCCTRDVEDVRELNFNHNSLKEVPHSVFAHERTLEELNLEANLIIDLPRALFHCHGLRILNISDNDIKVMPPAIASLINLEHLNLSKNSLSDIPDNIKCCKKLIYVNVSVNPLEKLPEGFTQLIALKELYLNDTFLEFLPANFGRLSKLQVLDLRDNNLNTLPKSIARLSNLQILDIGRNEFSDLPEVVGNLPELQELWADYNKIRSVPAFVGKLQNLLSMDMSQNNIQWISPEIEDCVNLSFLVMSGNELQNLPEEIGNLKALTILKLDDNDIDKLPRSIGKLVNLEELVFSQNAIETIPPTIGLLRKVTNINADDNRLYELPSELCSCNSLRILSVRNNLLSVMPAEIGHLTGIRVLNVADNLLRNLPVSILNLTNLNALWLATNQATPLTNLQQEIDTLTGLMVCVNFMFPQSEQESNLKLKSVTTDDEPVAVEKPSRPHIRFADSTDLRNTPRLTRAPTPYPKELRSMAKHARILTTKPMQELPDNEEETPLLGASAVVAEGLDAAAEVKTARVKKPTIAHEMVPMIDQTQDLYDGYLASQGNNPGILPMEERNQPQQLGLRGDEHHSMISGANQFNAGENTAMPANGATLITPARVIATMSDTGPTSLEETLMNRIDGAQPENPSDLFVMSDSPSLPGIATAHYSRTVAEQPPKAPSIEIAGTQIDQNQVDGLQGDHSGQINLEQDSAPDGVSSLSSVLPAPLKQPPPYHIAAMHSKKAAYFMNAPNGQSLLESPVPSPVPFSDPNDFPKPPSPPGKVSFLEVCRSPSPIFPQHAAEKGETFHDIDFSGITLGQVLQNLDYQSNTTVTNVDAEKSPRSPPAKCNIPILKTKDSKEVGNSGIPKPQSFTEDNAGLDKNVIKPSPQRPRESLSKIPSFTSKEPKISVVKKSPPTKLLQPGFHVASQLPLPKSPVGGKDLPGLEIGDAPMDVCTLESPSNGNREEINYSNGNELGNGIEADRSPLDASLTSPGFKSRIPARVSPLKGSAPTTPTSPTWVFGQHKNPTVFPLAIMKNPGLGFSISGGTATATPDKPDLGIFISKVQANGPASGLLLTGDKILEVDGIDFTKLEHDQAVSILKQTKNLVNMMISRQK